MIENLRGTTSNSEAVTVCRAMRTTLGPVGVVEDPYVPTGSRTRLCGAHDVGAGRWVAGGG